MPYYHLLIQIRDESQYAAIDVKSFEDFNSKFLNPLRLGEKIKIDNKSINQFDVKKVIAKTTTFSAKSYIADYNKNTSSYRYHIDKYDIFTTEHSAKLGPNVYKKLLENLGNAKQEKDIEKPTLKASAVANMKVFIVHGHDNEAKLQVARFIEKLGLEAIILHEQASGGSTIIEKLERHINEVSFGIVLYTHCDNGNVKTETKPNKRARQNVVFEHGLLIGKLGRDRVCALVKGDIEKPNDISGVVYTSLDEGNGWKLDLAKEMKGAGYQIDLNNL